MKTDGWKTDGSEFDISLLTGVIDPSDQSCDKQKNVCKYKLHHWNYDVFVKGAGQCPVKAYWDPAKIDGDKLTAGGKKQTLQVTYQFESESFQAQILKAHMSGIVSDKTGWKSTKSGKLCGVLTQKELFALIDSIPNSQMPSGITKDQVKSLLPSFIKTDIDIDGDNKPDAYSAAFQFETIPATITGVAK